MTLSTTLALLIGKRIGLRERVLIQKAYNQLDLSGLVELVRKILLVTLLLESCGALLLFLRFSQLMTKTDALYYAVFHAVSAFCNAGFTLFWGFNASGFSAFLTDWWVCLVIAGLVLTGGLGFPVLSDIKRRLQGRARLSLHSRLVLLVTLSLTISGFILFFLLEYNNPDTLGSQPVSAKALTAFFQSVNLRTAGFNILEAAKFREITLFVLLFFMFIGASPNSTGGGIKTTTFGVLMLAVWSVIRGRRDTELFERRLPGEVILKALTITVIAVLLVVLVTVLLKLTDNLPFLSILFEVVAAFSTTGLSTGITPCLSDPGRILLIITMFAGRVGLLTIVLALAQGLQSNDGIRYTEEKVIIG